ncbi:MAG: class I SAM-dependent methyltransferase [Opitutae bacterium]|nr:class I SAM-dependent methyltransferase [Opitutae bacterium]
MTPTGPSPDTPRLYSDLAWLWPLWGDPAGEYAHFARFVAERIRHHARRPLETLLDVACGGGKNLFTLQRSFRCAGLDLSPAMLALARNLNPECEFVQGDMRSFSLDRTFDAILIDDGVSHLTSRPDLAAAFQTAFRHLAPGGVMVVVADSTAETFRQNQTEATPAYPGSCPPGLDVTFIENRYDPDPADERFESTLIYLIREHGRRRIETDRFDLGLFPHSFWRQTLAGSGFDVVEESYRQDDVEYPFFVCRKPTQRNRGAPP